MRQSASVTISPILVAGLGKTGHSIARYLSRNQMPFVVFDTREAVEDLEVFQTEFPDVDVFLGVFPDELYAKLQSIITSPGVSLDEPFLQKAHAMHIPIYGDIECFAREVKVPVIAITGTNGKSTVTTLVGEMAKQAGFQVAVAGNIGDPVLDRLADPMDYDLWVLELSSFQLDLTDSLAPAAATILNITPDHLDRHHSMEAYIQAKQRVYSQAQTMIYNRQDIQTYPQNTSIGAAQISFGLDIPEGQNWGIIEKEGVKYLAHDRQTLMPVDAIRIKGKHNWENALAACALADSVGITDAVKVTVLQTFSGLPHRCQWVRTLDGVEWINDSKGTNVGATLSAIDGVGDTLVGKIVLIAGGLGKDADFSLLRNVVSRYVRTIILIGKDAQRIATDLAGTVPMQHADSFEAAIQQARLAAEPQDVVLLSPACASLDMFRDFNHRGERFAELVAEL